MLLPRNHRSLQHSHYVTPYRSIHHPTHIKSLTTSQSDFETIFTLTLSSVWGIIADRRGIFGGSAGTVLTLLSASSLSNLGFAPHSHRFYDFCWSKLLTATLVLTLLSDSADKHDETTSTLQDEHLYPITRKIFVSVFTSFLIASTGICAIL